MDGRKSFIFSWNKEHKSIHEEALLHYFNPEKKDEKFVPEKKGDEVPVTQVVPIQVYCVFCTLLQMKFWDTLMKTSATPSSLTPVSR